MAHRSPKKQGSKLPVDVLVGVSVPKLRGVNVEQDPSAIEPVQFTYLVNVRITEDGILINRGGLTKVNSTTPSGDAAANPVRGFHDCADIGAPQ